PRQPTATLFPYTTLFRSRWESDNDISINVDTSKPQTLASAEASYDNLLPSFDLTLNVTDDLVGRFSFSKTIARAGLGSLGVSASDRKSTRLNSSHVKISY